MRVVVKQVLAQCGNVPPTNDIAGLTRSIMILLLHCTGIVQNDNLAVEF